MPSDRSQFQISPCQCGQLHQGSRRWFLRSLVPGLAIAFPLLLTTQPARANENYDWTALAGASLALTGLPHLAEAQAFWDQLSLSRQLHQIEKVIILDHQDCGAYAQWVNPHLSKDPGQEEQVHADYLNLAYWEIRKRYPDLTVELYFVTLNNEVRPVLPRKLTSISG